MRCTRSSVDTTAVTHPVLLLQCAVAALLAGGRAISTLLPLGGAKSTLLPLRSPVAPLLAGGCTIAALLPLGGATIAPLLAVLALPRLLLLPGVPALLRRRAEPSLLARLLAGARLTLLAGEPAALLALQRFGASECIRSHPHAELRI